ncbi:sulfolactaldehyde 3-reductase [Succinatimonas hippei]|uniref:sulfolactaldehyde 3-reductase n=1 Tax=Succinatimonas hippei TaxID=626938 RepID=UPI0024915471|nr:sulfolactaldehyde 3-reductase [Succinatimonas hippei]
MSTVGFIGLGQMGAPMALNILQKGHKVKVYDISKEAVTRLAAKGAEETSSPAEAALNSDFVITMLPNGQLVSDVVFGDDGILKTLSNNALYIDMSTINPFESDAIRQKVEKAGREMMECPVGRTSADAITGTLLLLAGGKPYQIEKAHDILMCMGNEMIDAGGPGMGIRLKIVNNFMSIALNGLSAEAAVLCESMGLSLDVAIKMMSGTPAIKSHFLTTWQSKVLKGDISPAFMIDLAHKDLGIALDIANKLHVPMSMGAACRELYSEASAFGFGRKDWTSILEHLRKMHQGYGLNK